jgi:hypothetical protein
VTPGAQLVRGGVPGARAEGEQRGALGVADPTEHGMDFLE